jgi:hypothetical protein
LTHAALASRSADTLSQARCRCRFDGPHGAPL